MIGFEFSSQINRGVIRQSHANENEKLESSQARRAEASSEALLTTHSLLLWKISDSCLMMLGLSSTTRTVTPRVLEILPRVLVLNLLGGDPVHPIKSPSKSLDQFDGNLGIFSNDVGDAFFDMPNLSLSFGYDVGVL